MANKKTDETYGLTFAKRTDVKTIGKNGNGKNELIGRLTAVIPSITNIHDDVITLTREQITTWSGQSEQTTAKIMNNACWAVFTKTGVRCGYRRTENDGAMVFVKPNDDDEQ